MGIDCYDETYINRAIALNFGIFFLILFLLVILSVVNKRYSLNPNNILNVIKADAFNSPFWIHEIVVNSLLIFVIGLIFCFSLLGGGGGVFFFLLLASVAICQPIIAKTFLLINKKYSKIEDDLVLLIFIVFLVNTVPLILVLTIMSTTSEIDYSSRAVELLLWTMFSLVIISIVLMWLRERHKKKKSERLLEEYIEYYTKNKIPIIGKCNVCNRPIPKWYGISHKIVTYSLAQFNCCFYADELHAEYYKSHKNYEVFIEARMIYRMLSKGRSLIFIISAFMLYICVLSLRSYYVDAENIFVKGFNWSEPECSDQKTEYKNSVEGMLIASFLILWLFVIFLKQVFENKLIEKNLYFGEQTSNFRNIMKRE